MKQSLYGKKITTFHPLSQYNHHSDKGIIYYCKHFPKLQYAYKSAFIESHYWCVAAHVAHDLNGRIHSRSICMAIIIAIFDGISPGDNHNLFDNYEPNMDDFPQSRRIQL